MNPRWTLDGPQMTPNLLPIYRHMALNRPRMLSWPWYYHDDMVIMIPWIWFHDDGVTMMISWSWHHDHDFMIMVSSWGYHDHDTMIMTSWWWCHHDDIMIIIPWSCLHDDGVIMMIAWSWCDHGNSVFVIAIISTIITNYNNARRTLRSFACACDLPRERRSSAANNSMCTNRFTHWF